MIPRRVSNPPSIACLSENCLQGALSDCTAPSESRTAAASPINIETVAIGKHPVTTIDGTTTAPTVVANGAAPAATVAAEGHTANEEVERQPLQEIEPGNCDINGKVRRIDALEQNRSNPVNMNGDEAVTAAATTTTSTIALSSAATAASMAGVQYRKTRLKLPNQLPVNTSKNIDSGTAKQSLGKQANNVPKTTTTSIRARHSAVGPKHPQVQRLKEGLPSQPLPTAQPSVANRNTVAMATTVDPTPSTVDINHKSNEFYHKSKHGVADDAMTPSRKHFLRKLPPANKLRFQDPTTTQTVFTELYRDFPVNYASTTVVESIPLKPPPYCNPPQAPPPSTMPPFQRQAATPTPTTTSESAAAAYKIRLENENVAAGIGGGNQVIMESTASTTTTATSLATSSPTKSDCTTAHRIANEIRSKGNFALQKLSNISKLNHKNNRFFSSSLSSASKASAAATVNETSGSSVAAARKQSADESTPDKATMGAVSANATAASANNSVSNIKDDADTDVTRETLNVHITCSPLRHNGSGTKKSPPCDILTKPEFSSSQFKNIPVRPRKGVPHLENYCLFDPSKDFVNEKEVKRVEALAAARAAMAHNGFVIANQEYIYNDQLVYDTLEDDNTSANYFTIDPDYIEREPVHSGTSPNATLERHSQQIENIEKIIDDFLSHTKNGSGKVDLIDGNEVVLRTASPRAALKNSPQIDKLLSATMARRAASLPPPSTSSASSSPVKALGVNERHQRMATAAIHTRDTREMRQSRLTLMLKRSISLPQLLHPACDAVAVVSTESSTTSHGSTIANEPNYALFNPLPNSGGYVRSIQYKKRHGRPLSTHSDADSGFLSPVTPPEAPTTMATNATVVAQNEPAPTVVVLQQCDSIQGYIEVCLFIHSAQFYCCYYLLSHL